MQRSAKYALIAVVAVVVLGSLAFWYFILRSDAPERASLPSRDTSAVSSTTAPGGDGPPAAASADTADGIWSLTAGEEVFVGYRINELFAGESIEVTAVGRTPAVTGTMTVSGTTITAVDITADMTALASDAARRDSAIRSQGLETDRYPQATFTLTAPIELGSLPALNGTVDIVAIGELTLHGVTRAVQIPLQARWNGDSIDVAGGTRIVLADYDIVAISNPFVGISDNGEFEMQLTFTR
jgi:polyisoprenoid-binding protein YceI